MAAITITDATGTDSYELPDEIGTELSIGTAEDCSIPLPEVRGLSACHCRITRMEGGFILSDDQSTNGTYADARRIETEYLAPGITYTIGEATFVFEDGAAVPEQSDDAATQPLAADQQVTGAAPAAKKKVVRRKPVARRTTLNAAELQQAALKYKRDMARKRMTLIYIIIILLAAFYAGMALYSWQTTGNPLPVLLR